MDVTVRVWFAGSRADAFTLQRMIEAEGARVAWRPQASLAGDAQTLALSLMASGAYDGIKAAVARFRERAPDAEVHVEVEVSVAEPEADPAAGGRD